jgi:hypothetical protein
MNKSLSRRLFGKALATAPLAATHAATLGNSGLASAGTMAGSYPPTHAYQYKGEAAQADKAIDMAEHMRQRRAHLERTIRGEDDEIGSPTPSTVDQHYVSLQSISPNARMLFCGREHARRAKLSRMHWAKIELDNLLSNWKW